MITSLETKHLNKEFKELYKISFPKNERLSFLFLSTQLKTKRGVLVNYYDENNFIGFTFSVSFKSFTCLVFFATNPEYRNQGYGKKILDIYFKENNQKIIFLNCEAPENNDKENIKYRRFSFYRRNGFLPTSLIMSFKNIDYLSLVNRELNDNEFEELRNIFLHYGCTCKIDTNILSL